MRKEQNAAISNGTKKQADRHIYNIPYNLYNIVFYITEYINIYLHIKYSFFKKQTSNIIRRTKEDNFILIKRTIHQVDVKILNFCPKHK